MSQTKIKSEGSEYVTALRCLNQTISFYLSPKKTVLTGNQMKTNCEEREPWTEYGTQLYPHAFVTLFHSQNCRFQKAVILSSILAMGITRERMCGPVIITGAGIQLWTFLAQVPLLLQADLLSLRISEFNISVARFVNIQLVSSFLPVRIVSFLFANCSFTRCRNVLSGPW